MDKINEWTANLSLTPETHSSHSQVTHRQPPGEDWSPTSLLDSLAHLGNELLEPPPTDHQEALDNIREQLNQLEESDRHLKVKIEARDQKIQWCQSQLEQAGKYIHQREQAHQEAFSRKDAQYNVILQELITVRKTNNQYHYTLQENQTLLEENRRLHEALKAMENQLNNQQVMANQLRDAVDQAKERLRTVQTQKDTLQREKEALRTENEGLRRTQRVDPTSLAAQVAQMEVRSVPPSGRKKLIVKWHPDKNDSSQWAHDVSVAIQELICGT